MIPSPDEASIVFLNHLPFATCIDRQEASRMAFELQLRHHPRRVSVVTNDTVSELDPRHRPNRPGRARGGSLAG